MKEIIGHLHPHFKIQDKELDHQIDDAMNRTIRIGRIAFQLARTLKGQL